MGVTSTTPTSRRRYLSQDELEQFADIAVTDSTEADDRISQAEELIDAYVGYQVKFYDDVTTGKAVTGSTTQMTLQTSQQNSRQANYYEGMELEIIGGTGKGQRTTITASTYAGVVTFETLTNTAGAGSIYRIYQLGKFPRPKDVWYDSESGDNTYYKQIPEAVKRAVAAQVEFEIQMGTSYFTSDKSNITSETIGDYSYTRDSGANLDRLIAPKAQQLLRGIRNIKGAIIG